MRVVVLLRKYSEEAKETAFAYDLGTESYFGERYIATSDLIIGGMRNEEALKELYAHKRTMYRCKSPKEAEKLRTHGGNNITSRGSVWPSAAGLATLAAAQKRYNSRNLNGQTQGLW